MVEQVEELPEKRGVRRTEGETTSTRSQKIAGVLHSIVGASRGEEQVQEAIRTLADQRDHTRSTVPRYGGTS
jgi:hypothetical protein